MQSMSEPREPDAEDDSKQTTSPFPEPPKLEFQRPQLDKPSNASRNFEGIAVGVKLAYFFIAPLVAGWLIGYLIDRPEGGTDGQTWGTILGFGIGLIAFVAVTNKADSRPR